MKPTLPPQTTRPQPALRPQSATGLVQTPASARRQPVAPTAQPEIKHRDDQQAGDAPLRGLDAMMQDSLGRAELPPTIELVAALEAAHRFAPMADRAVPGLGRLVAAVIEDERHKLARVLDLGSQ